MSIPARRCLEACDILVLAGGLGTRIRPVLGDLPKLLAPIGGRPYLERLLDWFAHFGAARIVLALGHRADAVLDYLARHPVEGIAVETIVEPEPLGTAGAIGFARSTLRTDPVMVVNGDSFVEADLCAFMAAHRSSGAIGTLLCTEVDDAGRYGRVLIDDCGRICGFIEKDPTARGSALVNAGIYLFSKPLLDKIAAAGAASLERDVFERLPAGTLAGFAGRFRFIDIGIPESLAVAEQRMRNMPVRDAENSSR
jgi:mannose-1-phosphate guanylyltransferase